MGWDGILTGLVSVLNELPLVGGVPAQLDMERALTADELPAFVIDGDQLRIYPAPLTEFVSPITLYYLHMLRATETTDDLQAIRALVRATFDRLAANMKLNGAITNGALGWADTGEFTVEVGVISFRTREYLGFRMFLMANDKFGMSFVP